MLAIPKFEELVIEAQNAVRARCGITNFSESSVAGALIKIYASYLIDLYDILVVLDEQGNLSTATGDNLDKIGELFGVTRLPAKNATSIGMGNAVLFRNNSGVSVTIPIRTRLWSQAEPSISFLTETALTLGAGAEGYTAVTAVAPGDSYNVGPNALTLHDLGNSNITVTNILPISNGVGIESDDNYRYRIANHLLAKQGSNETAIRLRLLEIPGVKDVYLHPMARGTGTIDVTVLAVDGTVSQTLLDQVQAALEEVVAFGISAKAKAPYERPIDLAIRVTTPNTLEAGIIRSIVSAAARVYIDNLPVGDGSGLGDMIYNELISRVMDAHSDVTNVQIRMSVDNVAALNVDQPVDVGEKFFLRSIEVT